MFLTRPFVLLTELLEELRGRGYSSLTSIDDNTIGILYEGSQADMTFQKMPLEELMN